MKLKRKDKNKRVILIVLATTLIAVFAIWYVWQRSERSSSKAINSFESCAAAGKPIQESYPERCAANGKTFTNPKQSVQNPLTTISQGLKGTITLRSGDCMPKIAPAPSSCSVETYTTPTEVIIKKPKDLNNKAIKEVVKKIENVQGSFETELQPGIYSMYVKYKNTEYCNSFGGNGSEDCEFTVEAGKVTNFTLQINTATD